MARLFKKEAKEQVDAPASKKRFNLFRRGRSELPVAVSPILEAPQRLLSERKTQSYRISVYEVRSASPTSTSSTSGSDNGLKESRQGLLSGRRAESPGKRGRAKSPTKVTRLRSESPVKRQREPSPNKVKKSRSATPRTTTIVPFDESDCQQKPKQPKPASEPVVLEEVPERVSPRRGILKKRATFAMFNKGKENTAKEEAPFNLDIARQMSLTDAVSSDEGSTVNNNITYPLQARENSFVISQPKRTVSFSKDVRDPKPKIAGVTDICLGTRSGRRVPRRRGDFSLFTELEDLCYDTTYFCRCIGEMATRESMKKEACDTLSVMSDDDQSNGSLTIDRSTLTEGSI